MPQGKGRPYTSANKAQNALGRMDFDSDDNKPGNRLGDRTVQEQFKNRLEAGDKKRERYKGTKLQNRVQEIAEEKKERETEQKRRSVATRILVTPGKWMTK